MAKRGKNLAELAAGRIIQASSQEFELEQAFALFLDEKCLGFKKKQQQQIFGI